ncbi:MAG: hypothetical protein LBT86_01505 [Deltaproteobacteria bacterium]|jgi:hypothetical protein|nr:hypothetical protein [Deltaproteobacteria bacterium]
MLVRVGRDLRRVRLVGLSYLDPEPLSQVPATSPSSFGSRGSNVSIENVLTWFKIYSNSS